MVKKTPAGSGRDKNGHGRQVQGQGPVRASKKKQCTQPWTSSRTLATAGVSCALLVGLLAITYQYMYPKDKATRVSVVIRNHLNTALLMIEHKYKIDAALLDDPLAGLMTTKLRPVQERIASLRTQCSQYEKMQQIPGGPTHFIQTSLHEIRRELVPRILSLNMEALAILKISSERSRAMSKSAREMVKASALRVDEHGIKLLTLFKVHIMPMGDVPAEELASAKKESSLEHVAGLMEQLASMYEGLEQVSLKMNELQNLGVDLNKRRAEEFTKEEEEAMLPYLTEMKARRDKIVEFKKTNNKFLELFQELNSEMLKELNKGLEKLKEKDKNRRQPYLNLYMTITKDIDHLKIRIDNLRHPLAKRKPKV